LSNKIKLDLVGKQVTIDYDEEKTIGGKIYGYIYVDNTLYNENLIANGYCELKAERININKLDVLVQAQILARNKMLGIWEY
jgi:endonuclease YncB( thermonuclease family)